MLRRIAAGTTAAVVAAGLAAAPAGASGLPAPGDSCADVTQTEQGGLDPQKAPGFLFGPLADVPHLLSGDRACFTVSSEVPDITSARRRSSAPPSVGSPVPEVPTTSPPETSAPGGPGPGDSGPPPAAAPPAETAGPPPSPDRTPMMAPTPVSPGPTPTASPAEFVGPPETVLPAAHPPAEAPPRLPLTAADSRPLTVAGGASLVAAGLAWIGGARRRKKRPAGPAGR